MPKKSPTFKKKPRKKQPTNEQDTDLRGELLTAVCSGEYLRRPAFMEALEKSNLVEYLTEAFKAQQIYKTKWIHIHGVWTQEKWEAEIEDITKRFKENLPAALFAGALINATQVSSTGLAWASVEKTSVRRLAEFQFLSKKKQSMVDGRGRKPKIEFSDIYSAILKRGADASRKGVAFDLNVSEKALNDWRKARDYSTWKSVVEDVLARHERTTNLWKERK